MTTIKVNNQVITIANKSAESFDKESKSLESLALNIKKSIEALNIVNNVKAMEVFGYIRTPNLIRGITNGYKALLKNIIKFFFNLAKWCGKMIGTVIAAIINKIKASNQTTHVSPEEYKQILENCTKHPVGCNYICEEYMSNNSQNHIFTIINIVSSIFDDIEDNNFNYTDGIIEINNVSLEDVSAYLGELTKFVSQDNIDWTANYLCSSSNLTKAANKLRFDIDHLKISSRKAENVLNNRLNKESFEGQEKTNNTTNILQRAVDISNGLMNVMNDAIMLLYDVCFNQQINK